jgi:hypothetical protein
VVATERMASADAARLHMDRPTDLMVITCVFRFDEPLDWDQAAAAFTERLVPAFPHVAQRVVEPPVTIGLAAVAGALRRHLRAHDQQVERLTASCRWTCGHRTCLSPPGAATSSDSPSCGSRSASPIRRLGCRR